MINDSNNNNNNNNNNNDNDDRLVVKQFSLQSLPERQEGEIYSSS